MKAAISRVIPPVLLGPALVLLYALFPRPRSLIAGRYVLTQSDVPGFTEFWSGETEFCPSFSLPTTKFEIECQESANASS